METEVKQHVQLPTKMEKESELEPKDLLIYLTIKRHQNSKSKEAFPSLKRISELSGASIPTIRKIIQKLIDADYIEVKIKGRQHVYIFKEYHSFEAFSYEFLDDPNLTFMQKAYIVSVSPLMMELDKDTAVVHYTNKKLAEKINMPESTLSKIQRELSAKQYLKIMTDDLNRGDKVFNLAAFHQNIVFVLRNHEERIENTENEVERLKQRINELESVVTQLKKDKKKKKSDIEYNDDLIM